MTPEQIVDELTYRSYAYNRERSPEVSPERWEKVFGPQAKQMEMRLQAELWHAVDAEIDAVIASCPEKDGFDA